MEGAPQVIVRDLSPEHLDGVMEIERQSFPTPWSRALFEEEVGRSFSHSIVVLSEPEGEVLGYAVCWTVAEESHLLNIAVRPEARGKGIGRLLLRECIRRGKNSRSRSIFLEVRPGNEPAHSLYRREGFRFVGIRKGYYTDTGEDALVLSRPIGSADAV